MKYNVAITFLLTSVSLSNTAMPGLKLVPFFFHKYTSSNPPRFLLSFSNLSSATKVSTPNSPLVDYLTNTFKFTRTQAVSIADRFSWLNTPDKPQSVNNFFLELGFSEAQIKSAVHVQAQILFINVETILKPKIEFFQDLGLAGSDLGKFFSKHSNLLTYSLDRKLVPFISNVKKILGNDTNVHDLFRILGKCTRATSMKDPQVRLLANIALLESFGIVGPHLSMLLKERPALLLFPESVLRDLVSRVLDMGFTFGSSMLLHAMYTVGCLSKETFKEKLNLLYSFGFSEDECMKMFRKAPALFRVSEKKLKFGLDFFLNVAKVKKSGLVSKPVCLMFSMEKRVVPRYKVLQVIKVKKLLKKESNFCNVVYFSNAEFMRKFILRFTDDVDQLLLAYKGHSLDSGVGEEEEELGDNENKQI